MNVACAVVREDPPRVFLADDVETLQWVLALRLVAQTRPELVGAAAAEQLRDALLNERWGDAVWAWIEHTGTPVDVYPSFDVHEGGGLPTDVAAAELQFAPLFQDPRS